MNMSFPLCTSTFSKHVLVLRIERGDSGEQVRHDPYPPRAYRKSPCRLRAKMGAAKGPRENLRVMRIKENLSESEGLQ